MTDAEFEATRKRVEKWCDRWYSSLGLHWWQTTYTWKRETANYEAAEAYFGDAAVTSSQWQYRKAGIAWHLDVIAQMTDEDLELLVIHEFVHVLSSSWANAKTAAEQERKEFATECLARAFMWARRADYTTVEGMY